MRLCVWYRVLSETVPYAMGVVECSSVKAWSAKAVAVVTLNCPLIPLHSFVAV